MNCAHCGRPIENLYDTWIHRETRSTRCGSWKLKFTRPPSAIWDSKGPITLARALISVESAPLPSAFLVEKPSWIERLLQKLR